MTTKPTPEQIMRYRLEEIQREFADYWRKHRADESSDPHYLIGVVMFHVDAGLDGKDVPCQHCGSEVNHPVEARDVCPTYEQFYDDVVDARRAR